MERHALATLVKWKSDPARKPLIVQGARQVGKTWLLKEFARSQYANTVYVNCQLDPTITSVFAGRLDPDHLLQGLQIAAQATIEPASTLVIIDEIQEVPAALTSLKYFYEERPDIHIAAAGSLLGVAIRSSGTAFPVGKVNFLDLHPFDFDEFLRSLGEAQLAELLRSLNWDLVDTFRDRLIELLRLYMYIGGMPEPIVRYVETGSLEPARDAQEDILRGYQNDFAKYATPTVSRRIAEAWASLPAQLAREQSRFVFKYIREGARARDFAEAIQWLSDAGLVHKVMRFTKPASPMRTYEDANIFKLFVIDIGLLGAMARLPSSVLLDGTGIFEEFKGSLTEQYVLQEIVAAGNEVPMYWSPERPTAEVDFAIERRGEIIPIEVKAHENLRSKSLRTYVDRFRPSDAWRFSLASYRAQEDMTNIPLYAIGSWLAAI